MTTYLITGGTGFIGANLTRKLLNQEPNATIHLITQPGSSQWRLHNIAHKVFIHEIDLTNFTTITGLVQQIKPTTIFHLAAFGGMPNEQHQDMVFKVNLDATVNLLNACKQVGFDCFINTGSSSEYGKKNNAMREDDVLEPISDFGVAKAAATQFCLKEALVNQLPIYTVRPFSVYGPYELATRLIPTVITNSLINKPLNLASPTSVRDFIYVDDMTDLYLAIANKKPQEALIFNAGSGTQSTVQDVVTAIEVLEQKKLRVSWGTQVPRSWEPTHWQADVSRAKQVLGWQPRYTLETGLKTTKSWFKEHLHFYQESVPTHEQRLQQKTP